jgi:hypothetical protein
MIKNVDWSSCEIPVIVCEILVEIEFSQQIFKKYSNIKFTKIRLVGVELFCMDGRTDIVRRTWRK